MGEPSDTDPGREQPPARLFTDLLPAGEPATARQVVDAIDFRERAGADTAAADATRPYVILNMTSTVDGRASLAGRSGAISDRADRELFHALRSSMDAVMAGAGTVRVERYGRIIAEESVRRLRRERGLAEEPLACIVSGRLSLPPDTPLLGEPAARIAILTPSQASLPPSAAQVEYVRAARDGRLDLRAALAEVRERFGVRTLLCEGGPHLNSELLIAGVVDELFLSLAASVAGGEESSGEALRIIAGAEFESPIRLELLGVLESESRLFLRYGVRASAAERVSRETIAKSSLAS